MRKLIILGLGAAAVAWYIRSREAELAPSPAGEAESYPRAREKAQSDAAATADTVESEAIRPDTAADDPVVREQEDAAAAEAGAIGGEADTVTAESDPATRPVAEGSGDAEETFESTEDEGR